MTPKINSTKDNLATAVAIDLKAMARQNYHKLRQNYQELSEVMNLHHEELMSNLNSLKCSIERLCSQQQSNDNILTQPGACLRSIDCRCAGCVEECSLEKCLRSIDCQCAACIEDCLRGSYSGSKLADLDSKTECVDNGEFAVGMSSSNSVAVESVDVIDDLFLDEFFMESDGTNNTCKVFDEMTERNIEDAFGMSYTKENSDFVTFEDMYLNELFMEPNESKLNFSVPDLIRELDGLIDFGEMLISCLSTASFSYLFNKKKIDVSLVVFDPGGTAVDVLRSGYMQFVEYHFSLLLNVSSITWLLNCDIRILFNWLNHSRELLKRFEIKANVSSSLVEYCLDHIISYIATCSTSMKECTWEQFFVWNAYWINIMFGDNELFDPLVEFSMTFDKGGCVSLFQCVSSSEILSNSCLLPFLFIVETNGMSFVSEFIELLTKGSPVQVLIHTAFRNHYKLVDSNFVYKKGKAQVVISNWAAAEFCLALMQLGLILLLELINRFQPLLCPVKHNLLTDLPGAAICCDMSGTFEERTRYLLVKAVIIKVTIVLKVAVVLYFRNGNCIFEMVHKGIIVDATCWLSILRSHDMIRRATITWLDSLSVHELEKMYNKVKEALNEEVKFQLLNWFFLVKDMLMKRSVILEIKSLRAKGIMFFVHIPESDRNDIMLILQVVSFPEVGILGVGILDTSLFYFLLKHSLASSPCCYAPSKRSFERQYFLAKERFATVSHVHHQELQLVRQCLIKLKSVVTPFTTWKVASSLRTRFSCYDYATPFFSYGVIVLLKANDILEILAIQLLSTAAKVLRLLVLGRHLMIGEILEFPFDPGGAAINPFHYQSAITTSMRLSRLQVQIASITTQLFMLQFGRWHWHFCGCSVQPGIHQSAFTQAVKYPILFCHP